MSSPKLDLNLRHSIHDSWNELLAEIVHKEIINRVNITTNPKQWESMLNKKNKLLYKNYKTTSHFVKFRTFYQNIEIYVSKFDSCKSRNDTVGLHRQITMLT